MDELRYEKSKPRTAKKITLDCLTGVGEIVAGTALGYLSIKYGASVVDYLSHMDKVGALLSIFASTVPVGAVFLPVDGVATIFNYKLKDESKTYSTIDTKLD